MYDKRIDTLFLRLAAIYGQLWLSSYQNTKVLEFAKREWSDSLKSFDAQTLKEALQRIKNASIYPPTLPMFVECCKATHNRLKPAYTMDVHSNATPEVARYHIQKMKHFVRGDESC